MIPARSSNVHPTGLRLGAVLALSASLLAAVPAPASAGGDAGAVAAGIIGGVALGALAVGAARPAGPPPRRFYSEPEPVYYPAPPPPPRYYEEPACGWEMRRSWDGYRWVRERVRVCD
ncbi:MAG: uncharacterized protein JWM36_765 [Hyphomicrobiales bacterium]|nr:uncharacterized protein [Hyphomicrobiales bacterium]